MNLWLGLVLGSALLAADWPARQQEALRWEAQREHGKAAQIYEQALNDGVGDPLDLQLSLGEIAFHQGDYAAARRWCHLAESTIGDRPDSPRRPEVLLARAVLELVDGKLTSAETHLRKALALSRRADHVRSGILHNLASLEMQTGQWPEAERHQAEAIDIMVRQLGPSHEDVRRAWISSSTLAALRGDWPEAERRIRSALKIAETPDALSNYAVILEKRKKHHEARRVRRQVEDAGWLVAPSSVVDVQQLSNAQGQRVRVR